jgi:hypothetical protein
MSTEDTYQPITVTIERITFPTALAGKHRLSFHMTDQHAVSLNLTQGELIALWQEIGVYYNLAGMRDAKHARDAKEHQT